jgi:hypothetical protein
VGYRARPDPSKAFKRVKALRAQIQSMLDEFPDIEQLRACSEELGTITVEDFKNEQPKSQVEPTELRKPAPAPQAPETTDEAEETEPAMGVSDLLDEALRDIEAA